MEVEHAEESREDLREEGINEIKTVVPTLVTIYVICNINFCLETDGSRKILKEPHGSTVEKIKCQKC